ncbi:MAG: flagellar motor protein MotB [Firmicutes bacterium]|nr:flagellar motor protein MotB [Bacillota bacterium]
MAKKPQKPHEDHPDEGWLLPYSDMMTLLLALFIVMFAVSSVDQAKFNSMMEAMYTAFGGDTAEGIQLPLPYPDADLPLTEKTDTAINSSLPNLYLSLNSYVIDQGLQDSIAVQYSGSDILVTIKNDVFFASASADLSPEMQEQAKILAQLLLENQDPLRPFDVIVAGHTDNVPINNVQFPSNWHLSAHRALNFLDALLTGSQLDPTHFSSRGYGEYAPVATNDTPEGRQQNRRVELLISEPISPQQEQDQATTTEGGTAEGDAPSEGSESSSSKDAETSSSKDTETSSSKDAETPSSKDTKASSSKDAETSSSDNPGKKGVRTSAQD